MSAESTHHLTANPGNQQINCIIVWYLVKVFEERQHQETTGMGFSGQQQTQGKAPQKGTIKPIVADKKIGRNEKIFVQSPNGEKIQIKYKKLQQYLKQGFTQV